MIRFTICTAVLLVSLGLTPVACAQQDPQPAECTGEICEMLDRERRAIERSMQRDWEEVRRNADEMIEGRDLIQGGLVIGKVWHLAEDMSIDLGYYDRLGRNPVTWRRYEIKAGDGRQICGFKVHRLENKRCNWAVTDISARKMLFSGAGAWRSKLNVRLEWREVMLDDPSTQVNCTSDGFRMTAIGEYKRPSELSGATYCRGNFLYCMDGLNPPSICGLCDKQ